MAWYYQPTQNGNRHKPYREEHQNRVRKNRMYGLMRGGSIGEERTLGLRISCLSAGAVRTQTGGALIKRIRENLLNQCSTLLGISLKFAIIHYRYYRIIICLNPAIN